MLQILSNYATVLRKLNHLDQALSWYETCLAINPTNPEVHAHVAFTLHLSGRYTEAIDQYHKSLAIRHTPVCADMLSRAMNDYVEFGGEEMVIDVGSPTYAMRDKARQPAHLEFSMDSL